MPELGSEKVENAEQRANDFVSSILTALINDNDIQNGKIGSFENAIFEENIELLLASLAKEMTYNGLHDYAFFKKKLYPLYLHIFEIIRLINKEDVKSAFEKIS